MYLHFERVWEEGCVDGDGEVVQRHLVVLPRVPRPLADGGHVLLAGVKLI